LTPQLPKPPHFKTDFNDNAIVGTIFAFLLSMNAEQVSIEKVLFDADQVQSMVDSMAHAISVRHTMPSSLVLIGIQQKGVLVKESILKLLHQKWPNEEIATGELDIGMFRDDLGANPIPEIQPTSIPDHLDDMDVVLVDDVLQSGRTTRAALDALRDFGRPRSIQLAVLFDRGQRRLPIQPDYVGHKLDIEDDQLIVVKSLEEDAGLQVYLTLK
jgi:pyrimidine operon attenuation protein/uracil phosphoribosyltransferase